MRCVAMKFGTGNHGPQRINPKSLMFHLAPPAGQNVDICSEISTEWIGTNFDAHIHVPLGMNPNHFSDAVTLPTVPL